MASNTGRAFIEVLAALLCVTTASAQENHGTPEQRAACAPDAFRFCSSYIPDAVRVENCLRQRTAELSNACRSVSQGAEEAQGSEEAMSESRRYRK
jgi:hypothetical protein